MTDMDSIHDRFSIDLHLHHPSCEPNDITEALSLEPWFSRRVGDQIGKVVQRSTSWLCHFQRGEGETKFGEALEKLTLLISQREDFLLKFTGEGGQIEVALNSWTEIEEGKLFELCLYPVFLNQLSIHKISLRIQVWKGDAM